MIGFRGFTKRFGATVAVDALDFEVAAGEVVALLGPNGSGKTTTLKGAAGLIRPTAGQVVVGDPPRPAADAAARSVCSYLPQKATFPDALSGREVLDFYRALREVPASRVDLVLKFASLNGASDRTVGTYSGGMVQRLGLAVAVLPDAPVLLLDEPTAALDPDGLCAFYGLVEQRRREGKTVLFTSHQLGDVERLADRFAVLIAGRLSGSFGGRELAERLADRGVMRVRLGACNAGVLGAVNGLAPGTRWAEVSSELIVPGRSTARPAILDAIRAAGAEIRGITAEEGRLDAFYRELVEDHR
ncbi:MAG TPA: ABC transporter ATP-binding protein [Vicinamibacterales bacterium]|nr:ABC transporter ATP-binding protein [Vicinamibacterales bacterium]